MTRDVFEAPEQSQITQPAAPSCSDLSKPENTVITSRLKQDNLHSVYSVFDDLRFPRLQLSHEPGPNDRQPDAEPTGKPTITRQYDGITITFPSGEKILRDNNGNLTVINKDRTSAECERDFDVSDQKMTRHALTDGALVSEMKDKSSTTIDFHNGTQVRFDDKAGTISVTKKSCPKDYID